MFSEFIPIPNYMKLISELKGMGRRIQISNNHLTLINTEIVVIRLSPVLSYKFLFKFHKAQAQSLLAIITHFDQPLNFT